MATIVCWQIEAVGFVVDGDDDSAHIRYVVLRDVFFVDGQHVGRSNDVELSTVVEFEAVELAEVMRFIDAQNY